MGDRVGARLARRDQDRSRRTRRDADRGGRAAGQPATAEGLYIRARRRWANSIAGGERDIDRAIELAPAEPMLRIDRARHRLDSGDVDGALAAAARLQVPATHALIVRDVASAAAQAGDDRDALRAAQSLPDARGRVAAMLAVLGVQLRAGRTEAARQTLEAAGTALNSVERTEFGAGALAALAVALQKIGDPGADARLEEAFAAAKSVPDSADRAAAYLAIAAALAD